MKSKSNEINLYRLDSTLLLTVIMRFSALQVHSVLTQGETSDR